MELQVTGTFTINVTTKKCRFTDTTDYSLVGLDPSLNQMKFLGVISFQGTPLYSKLTVGDPLIDLQSGATYFEFDAELDSNGDIANGVYSVSNYSTTAVLTLTDAANTDSLFVFSGNSALAPFLSAGDTIDVSLGSNQGIFTIVEVAALSGFLVVEVAESVVTETGTNIACTFDITTQLNQTQWTYSGCVLINASVNLVSDCNYGDNGTWSVSNTTVTTTQTLVSTSATINYPSWTGEAPIVVTSLPYVNNRLATGTFSVVAAFVYSQVENDGLIIQYTASCAQEFDVRCAQPLCSLNKCIENLRVANANAINSGRVSPFQVYVDNISLLWIEAQNYLACGQLGNYQSAVEAIQVQLDSSGCDCGCCEDSELRWITNGSADSIIQWGLFDGVPSVNQDTLHGYQLGSVLQDINTKIAYICENPSNGAAVWEIYYDPNLQVEAENVSFNPNPLIAATNVQDAIDDTLSITVFLESNITNLATQVSSLTTEVNSKVESVTGLNTNNTDPQNPVIAISVDGTTITGLGTPASPLEANLTAENVSFNVNPALGLADTVQEAIDNATTLILTKVTSVVGLNTNNSDPENPVIQISVDGTTITGSGTPLSPLQANGSLPYQSYVAIITNANTIDQIYNDTGATLSSSNPLAGVWQYTFSSAILTSGKTFFSYTPSAGNPNQPRTFFLTRNSTTQFSIFNFINGILSNIDVSGYIEIRIYP
jgi:hypothetical protein